MATLQVSHALLDLAVRAYGYALPDDGLVFFGIRGAFPDNPGSLDPASVRTAGVGGFDHLTMRCSLGQWDRTKKVVALFPGSTVPSIGSIATAKDKGGAGTNLLMPGRYEFVKGVHKSGKPSGHPAFRQNCFFPVRRTSDNVSYDNFDRIDFGTGPGSFVGDNLHSAYHELPDGRFSSAGCQVISGLPASPARGGARETGAWRVFKDTAYALEQDRFPYLLFLATELATLSAGDPASLRPVVRYGSGGEAAKLVQAALVTAGDLAGTADGSFGRKSCMALAAFQERVLGRGAVDASCGPATAAALKIQLPGVPQPGQAAPGAPTPVPSTRPDGVVADLPDETDLSPSALRAAMERAGLQRFFPQASGADRPETFSRQVFFDACRQSLFGGTMRQSQVAGMDDLLDVWDAQVPGGDPRWLAYILASVFHETGQRMVPVREGFKNTDQESRLVVLSMFKAGRIKQDYGIPVNGISYFGRGRVQVTHFDNYKRCAVRFKQDFVNEPNLLLESRIDAPVSIFGHIEGLWTGVKLADFISGNRCDYVAARRIVNGQDKAELIAGIARSFERAITQALAAPVPNPVPPATPPRPDNDQIERKGTLMSAEADAINARIDRLEALIRGQDRAPSDPPGTTPAVGIDPDAVAAVKAIVAELVKANPQLAPVNNALGATLGGLLSGKKSAIGIVGSVLTAIVGNAVPGGTLGQLTEAVVKVVPALGGMSGPMLPIFLALTAWGVLGKQEKWNLADVVARLGEPKP